MDPVPGWMVPPPHDVHAEDPFKAAKVPTAQSVHPCWPVPPWDWPMGHMVHAVPPPSRAKVPAAHAAQSEVPWTGAMYPGRHSWQFFEASAENCPGAHTVQLDMPWFAAFWRPRRTKEAHGKRAAKGWGAQRDVLS